MAARNSQELGISVNTDSSIAQFQGGGYRPQEPNTTGPSLADTALAGLLSIGAQYAEAKFGQQAEEAYLRGGIAAAQGQSADSVAADPFVAPFANGGYNDENYRLVQTKETTDFQAWLAKEGHQYAPDDPRVTEALNRASGNTMAAITPEMTARGRAEALMSQNKTNEALVTQHNKAYKDFSVAEAARRVMPQGNQIVSTLINSMNANDHATYQAMTDKAALYFTDINNNASLSETMRQDISKNFLSALINADQREPVENMRRAGLLDSLPFDIREKLDTDIRESKNRTEVKDLGNKIASNAFFEQGASEGNYSIPEIESYVQQGYTDGWMTLPHAMSLYDQAAKGRSNKQKTSEIIGALNRRELSGPNGLYALGSSVPDGMDVLEKQLRGNGVPDVQRLGTMVGIGLDLGYIPKSSAESVGQAVRALGAAKPGQPVSPDFVNTLNLATSLVQTAGKTAPYKAQVLLESMPDDTRGAMSYVVAQAEYGIKPEEALRNFWANNAAIKEMPDAARQRHTEKWRKQYGDAINKQFPKSYFGNFFRGLVGDTQRIDDSPVSENQILTSVWSEMRYQESNPNNLGVPEDSLVELASAAVRSRVIPVTDGGELSKATPLIMERGADINGMFGTNDRAIIGRALATNYPAANENVRSMFVWDAVNKQVVNKQVDEFGNSLGETPVDSNKLKASIQAAQSVRDDATSRANFGDLRKVGDSLLTIDGRNSADVPHATAYAMRDLLLKVAPDQAAQLAGIPPGEVSATPLATNQAERMASLGVQLVNSKQPNSAQFRDATDLVISRTVRHIAPAYIQASAQAAIAVAVITEGPVAADKIVQAATRAIDSGDSVAFQKALSTVQNEKVRAALTKALPDGRIKGRVQSGTDLSLSDLGIN